MTCSSLDHIHKEEKLKIFLFFIFSMQFQNVTSVFLIFFNIQSFWGIIKGETFICYIYYIVPICLVFNYLFIHLLLSLLFTEQARSQWEGGNWRKIRMRGGREPCSNLRTRVPASGHSQRSSPRQAYTWCVWRIAKGQVWHLWGRQCQGIRSER